MRTSLAISPPLLLSPGSVQHGLAAQSLQLLVAEAQDVAQHLLRMLAHQRRRRSNRCLTLAGVGRRVLGDDFARHRFGDPYEETALLVVAIAEKLVFHVL